MRVALLALAVMSVVSGAWADPNAPLSTPVARADLALVMIEQPGCVYCARWDREIAAIYPLTAEGRAAPLIRLQLHADLPAGMVFDRPAVFTPTFVLVERGVERGRIEGYPGEDFFWGLLAGLLSAPQPNAD